jgi:hypothetical protein
VASTSTTEASTSTSVGSPSTSDAGGTAASGQ